MNLEADVNLERLVEMRRWLQFTNLTLRLDKIGYNLAPEGQKKLFTLIYQYITNHKNSRWIGRQSFAFGPEIVSFTVLSRDAERIQRAITEILKAPESLTKNYVEVSKNGLLETVLPYWTIKKKKIWKIKTTEV